MIIQNNSVSFGKIGKIGKGYGRGKKLSKMERISDKVTKQDKKIKSEILNTYQSLNNRKLELNEELKAFDDSTFGNPYFSKFKPLNLNPDI